MQNLILLLSYKHIQIAGVLLVEDLSQKGSVFVDYLISKGSPSDRMVPVGYGEAPPRAEGLECKSIDKMSTKEEQEAAHQRNRRTQFRVLSSDFNSPEQD